MSGTKGWRSSPSKTGGSSSSDTRGRSEPVCRIGGDMTSSLSSTEFEKAPISRSKQISREIQALQERLRILHIQAEEENLQEANNIVYENIASEEEPETIAPQSMTAEEANEVTSAVQDPNDTPRDDPSDVPMSPTGKRTLASPKMPAAKLNLGKRQRRKVKLMTEQEILDQNK